MDWNTILSVALGGLIAIIPVIISNRFQAREKEKDRLEQRRDARIQTKERIMGTDIDKALDLLDKFMKSINFLQSKAKDIFIADENTGRINELIEEIDEIKSGILTINEDELVAQLQKLNNEFKRLIEKRYPQELQEHENIMYSLIVLTYSLDKEISLACSNFVTASTAYLEILFAPKTLDNIGSGNSSHRSEKLSNMIIEAGNLQRLLREKKILIRDEN